MTTLFSPSETSYTTLPLSTSSSLPSSSLRADARSPLSYRTLILDTALNEGTNIGNCRLVIGDTIGGYTEVWAGVRAEVEDCLGAAGGEHGEDEEGGRVVVGVEFAPTTLSLLPPTLPLHLSNLLSTLYEPTLLPPSFLSSLTILPGKKAWKLYVDVLVISANGGNVVDLTIIATRTALAVARLPPTRAIGFVSSSSSNSDSQLIREGETEIGSGKESKLGINGLMKGGKGGKGIVDFELVDDGGISGGGGGGERLKGWEELGVGVTLGLMNQLPYLDSTILEECSTTSQIIFCFSSKGDLNGIKQIGEGEIEFSRLMPLLGEARKISSELIQVLNAKLKDV